MGLRVQALGTQIYRTTHMLCFLFNPPPPLLLRISHVPTPSAAVHLDAVPPICTFPKGPRKGMVCIWVPKYHTQALELVYIGTWTLWVLGFWVKGIIGFGLSYPLCTYHIGTWALWAFSDLKHETSSSMRRPTFCTCRSRSLSLSLSFSLAFVFSLPLSIFIFLSISLFLPFVIHFCIRCVRYFVLSVFLCFSMSFFVSFFLSLYVYIYSIYIYTLCIIFGIVYGVCMYGV